MGNCGLSFRPAIEDLPHQLTELIEVHEYYPLSDLLGAVAPRAIDGYGVLGLQVGVTSGLLQVLSGTELLRGLHLDTESGGLQQVPTLEAGRHCPNIREQFPQVVGCQLLGLAPPTD